MTKLEAVVRRAFVPTPEFFRSEAERRKPQWPIQRAKILAASNKKQRPK